MTVCFTAIVKNESAVIGRCIKSCLPFIDSWCVVDTGSTDGTQKLVKKQLKHLPGELVQSDWKGFGASRTEAIRAAESRADYLLMMDADHTLGGAIDRAKLTADLYQIQHRFGSIHYTLPILFATRIKWHYEMPVHEHLAGDRPTQAQIAEGVWIDVHPDGARSKDPKKFQKDAEALERWCKEHPDHARGQYYLAQSLRDAGELEKSYEAYQRRAQMPGWDQETWSAFYESAKLLERQGKNPTLAYLGAFNMRPSRAEPLWALARWCRLQGLNDIAYLYARRAAEIPRPPDILFVEHEVYDWCALDELSIAAWYVNQKDVGREAQKRIDLAKVPKLHQRRVKLNRGWYGLDGVNYGEPVPV